MGDASVSWGLVDMIDVWQTIRYMEKKYNASVKVSWDNHGHGIGHGVLCVSIVARCGVVGHDRLSKGWYHEPSAYDVRQMPYLLQQALYSLLEEIDGACPQCNEHRGETVK